MSSETIFQNYITQSLQKEGERFTNNPLDHGGPTKWGITQVRAIAAGFVGSVADMTMAQAITIYRLFYWTQPQFDKVSDINPPLSGIMLDLGINFGPYWPGYWAQRALNVLNQNGKDWHDLTADGAFGALSRSALSGLLGKRGDVGNQVLQDMVIAQASVRYIEIAEHDPSQETFEYGWQRQRAFGSLFAS